MIGRALLGLLLTLTLGGVAAAQSLAGAPPSALTQISCVTTSGSAPSVSFSSIPGNFTNLRLVGLARGDTAASTIHLNIQFNADSGSNYDWQTVVGSNTTASAGNTLATTSITLADMVAASGTAGRASAITADIPSYSSAVFDKSVLILGGSIWGTGAANAEVVPIYGTWRNTAAITGILVFPATGNFVNGSSLCLYGM